VSRRMDGQSAMLELVFQMFELTSMLPEDTVTRMVHWYRPPALALAGVAKIEKLWLPCITFKFLNWLGVWNRGDWNAVCGQKLRNAHLAVHQHLRTTTYWPMSVLLRVKFTTMLETLGVTENRHCSVKELFGLNLAGLWTSTTGAT